jgi:hypothetical protein
MLQTQASDKWSLRLMANPRCLGDSKVHEGDVTVDIEQMSLCPMCFGHSLSHKIIIGTFSMQASDK